ncbi:MAG: sulfatase [bacterium]|nr:sulfatase [bacterium]
MTDTLVSGKDAFGRRNFLKLVGAGMASLALGRAPAAAETAAPVAAGAPDGRKPNVVFILADDLGWRDLAAFGSTYYETPNIDALARRGMMFTQAYAANPLCSPTRSSIMTGLWPARIGITSPVCHVPEVKLEETLQEKTAPTQKALIANSATRLKQEYVTLAESLKAGGYKTGHFGKWHLGAEPYDPLHQGFDVDIPHTSAPSPLVNGYLAPWPVWPGAGAPGEHLEDRMAKEAAKFIKENKDRPFFLNYWCFSVHSPWQAKEELIRKFAKTADPAGLQRNPVYAAMVKSMDDAVGTLMKTLDESGLTDNTIVIFMSDNGGFCWPNTPVMDKRYTTVPVTSNLPLRGGKATIYEGGTREPLIVAWPGRIQPGSKNETAIVQSIDFHPTVLEMCGVAPPSVVRFDGISFLPALSGKPLAREAIFCHFPHNNSSQAYERMPAPTPPGPATYVRKGDWKLIRFYCDNPDQTDRHELYNLKDDLGETKDLSAAMPDKVKELSALIDAFLRESGAVVPKANPAYDPNAKRPAAGARGTARRGASGRRRPARNSQTS